MLSIETFSFMTRFINVRRPVEDLCAANTRVRGSRPTPRIINIRGTRINFTSLFI